MLFNQPLSRMTCDTVYLTLDEKTIELDVH